MHKLLFHMLANDYRVHVCVHLSVRDNDRWEMKMGCNAAMRVLASVCQYLKGTYSTIRYKVHLIKKSFYI